MADDSHRKDLWDRLTALAAILVPAAIALAGHFIGQGLKEAELRGQERQAQQASAIAEANTKIAQAGLINTLMKSLTSPNPQERKLAVQTVLIALPDQGPLLARTIAQTDEDEAVQVAARSSLKQRADTLIRQLFADDAAPVSPPPANWCRAGAAKAMPSAPCSMRPSRTAITRMPSTTWRSCSANVRRPHSLRTAPR